VALTGANARLERVNDELARSNAELDRFASIASHDLREPLRKVQMFSERVIHHESDNLSDRGRDYLGRMDAAAARMQTLIDGLLTYARVTTRLQPLEDVDLEQVAREVADDLDVIRRETGGRIEIGPLPHVSAEALRMRQLVQNLISNALRFHREGVPPVVRVSGSREGDEVVLEVADNGIGFEPRHVDRAFELFGRLHPRAAYPGTGMGLALCRRIVERHGGTIEVRTTPGAGSTFTVRLPATPPAPAETPAAMTEGDDPRFVAYET
jgi:light-regulated signal transduction histidine kinase (bacteriophytochrome)